MFTVYIEGLRTVPFTVTTTDIESGEVNFDLPQDLLSGVGVCSVRGVVFGGNHIGNSTTVGIQLPTGKPYDHNILFLQYSCPCVPTGCLSVLLLPTGKFSSTSTAVVIPTAHMPQPSVTPTISSNSVVHILGITFCSGSVNSACSDIAIF